MKSMQRMLGFMTICMVAMSVNMHKFNDDKSLIPQRWCSKLRSKKDRNEKMTIKQRKARKRAKNNKRKCTKRR